MSEKLGKQLVEGGIVTAAELREARENAVVHGGSLSEALFELGFVDDSALAKFISADLGIGFVSDDLLGLIDPEMIQIIPPDIAGEHHVVPLEFSNGVLEVAMSDPFDQRITGEIEFFTGYPIKPMVATIRGIARALKSYYGIAWSVRPPSVTKAEESVLVNWDQMKEAPAPADPIAAQPTPSIAPVEKPTKPDTPASIAAAAAPPTPSLPLARSDSALGRLARQRPPADADILDEIVGMVHADGGGHRKAGRVRAQRRREGGLSFVELLTELEAAPNRDEIAELALIALEPHVDRLLLATLKGELIVGWTGRGAALSPAKSRSFLVPLSLPSVFQQALTIRDVVEDKPGSGPIDLFMIAFLGGTRPARVTAVPVVARGRTVAFVYGDVDSPSRPSAADAFRRVSVSMGTAFGKLLDSPT